MCARHGVCARAAVAATRRPAPERSVEQRHTPCLRAVSLGPLLCLFLSSPRWGGRRTWHTPAVFTQSQTMSSRKRGRAAGPAAWTGPHLATVALETGLTVSAGALGDNQSGLVARGTASDSGTRTTPFARSSGSARARERSADGGAGASVAADGSSRSWDELAGTTSTDEGAREGRSARSGEEPLTSSDDASTDEAVSCPDMLTARATWRRIGEMYQATVPPLQARPPPADGTVGGARVWAPLDESSDRDVIGETMAGVWTAFNRGRLHRLATPLAAPDPAHHGALRRAYRVSRGAGGDASGLASATHIDVVFEDSSAPTSVALADVRMARCVPCVCRILRRVLCGRGRNAKGRRAQVRPRGR